MKLPKGRVGTRLTEHFNLKISPEEMLWVRSYAESQGCSQAQVVRSGLRLLQEHVEGWHGQRLSL